MRMGEMRLGRHTLDPTKCTKCQKETNLKCYIELEDKKILVCGKCLVEATE